jgi:hypothetical protein
MPQHDLDVANGSGAAVRADLNGALAALGSTMKGPNAPSAPVAGMMWVEDDNPSSTRWTVRMYDGADWISMGVLDATANRFEPANALSNTGGTVQGDVTIDKSSPIFTLNKPAGTAAVIDARTANALRWRISLGTAEAESGGNAGSNLFVTRYGDGGVAIEDAIAINRATGVANFAQRPTHVGAGLLTAGNVSVAAGSWSGTFDLTLSDTTFFDILLPTNTQSVIGSGFIATDQTTGTIELGVFEVAVLNASLVEQSRHTASLVLSVNGALSNSGLTVGFNALAANNSGWRLRFLGRKTNNQGPFNVNYYQARILCVTR